MDMHALESKIFFGDSYQTSRRVLKDKLKRFTLGHVYQLAFDATFNAHNAYDDSKVTNSNISELRKLVTNGNVANKLGKLGFSCELLKDMWKKFGEEKCLSYFCTCNPRSKYPRVSKDVKDLIVIAKALRG